MKNLVGGTEELGPSCDGLQGFAGGATLVVTGAAGLLGANLLLTARRLGYQVIGITRRETLRIPGIAVVPADLTDLSTACDLVASLRPDAIIHCAAATNVDWCEGHAHETEKINVQTSAYLAGTARKLNAQFLYVSTDSVFDGKRGFYREADTPAPVNCYATSKWLGEQAVNRAHSAALIVRVNIYGWNAQKKQSLAEWVLDRLRAEEMVPGFMDVFFTPILVNDLSEAMLAMLKRSLTGTYHVVGSERVSKYEFARAIAAMFGFDPERILPSHLAEARLRAQRPADVSLNTEKISGALGSPMPDVAAGLKRFRTLEENGYVAEMKTYLMGAVNDDVATG
jgi:dTDP-4-dehydrorhamnose reductase